MAAIRPRTVGVCLGESCDFSAMSDSWFWGESNIQQLMGVRHKWDPKQYLIAAHYWQKDANLHR
ncbi:uncharacterized protein EURHEDRAFT_408979 [Aspergillus ruber CBS 135680]|uniref:Berberine/berberine-like domain-containing protein n=1 Tax=Aspergillus ruber (strain CBS 135680) TaxID=1388766 RepID=A0A017SQV6_ASPRC|nr:uncharacterized protein EURHEDRAFT_408979 [Aspergillus ruber CBS 135680]EYE98640.1 hypothetical protein EURHEDRAFT_408979 [Aspergillus ruber CBS 135680]